MKTSLELVAIATVTSLMLVAVAACGKKDDARDERASQTTTTSASPLAKASCDMLTELGTCNEYRNGSSFGLEKSMCEGFHGKFASAGCSTVGQIGSCVMSDGEVKRYYGPTVAGDHALSVEEAKDDCESELVKGKFTVDPRAATAQAEEPKPEPKAARPQTKATKAARPAVKPAKAAPTN